MNLKVFCEFINDHKQANKDFIIFIKIINTTSN